MYSIVYKHEIRYKEYLTTINYELNILAYCVYVYDPLLTNEEKKNTDTL